MISRREQTLKTLHTAAAEIQRCESIDAACERTVTAAEEVLDFLMCSVILYEDGWLVPVAVSSGAPTDGARRMAPDQGLAGKTYQTGEPTIIDEVQPDDDTDPAKETYRSGLSVPIGEAGVFQAVSTEPHAFNEGDLEFTELLVSHTARTIDRIRYEQELQRSRDRLQRQNERLEKFASVVSHDLRNPLNVAQGRLDLACEEIDNDHLDVVARAHDRMERLLEDLLRLAREGKPVQDLTAVDLVSILSECWDHVRTAEATLEIESAPIVEADHGRLTQLFENLLRNAVEHGGDDVTVTVGPLEDGFYVADDGSGIPDMKREEVFEWGYSTRESGTGFGLAIVEEIVAAHGWEIIVTESEAGGARFEITGVEIVE